MRGTADFFTETGADGSAALVLTGPLLVSSVGTIDRRLRALEGPIASIDLSRSDRIDTVGAWTAWSLSKRFSAPITGASPEAERLIAAIRAADDNTAPIEHQELPILLRVPEQVGVVVAGLGKGLLLVLGFLGQIVLATGTLLRHPGRFRIRALVHQMELMGVNALAIIALMSFLVGIVIAQQGAVQLRQFGAEIYTVNLVGRLSLRELGILMTAIMVAGRSGSAFAAQLGTMKLTEEIDAMRTIGVSPVEALVIPRILAAVVMMPLLGFYAAMAAIVGGAFISSFTLGIPFMTFILRVQEVVPIHDVWVGLVKAPFFGLIIAMAGCYQGMQVKANAEEVGLRTTMAVVQAIFMVIVLDAFFAVFYTEVGWG